jgi:hypothetical protein
MSTSEIVLDGQRLELLQSWINYCIDWHQECGRRELALVFPESVGILLIDVKRMCLVNAATKFRYLALSYVWGRVRQFNTTAAHLEDLLKENSLEKVKSEIPNVIQDAIYLSRCLGEDYLWVDSLCIVQDDPLIKHKQLALMAEIYNSATVTIIACAGCDADAKLFESRLPQEHIKPRDLYRIGERRVTYRLNFSPGERADLSDYEHQYYTGLRRPEAIESLIERIAKFHYSQRGWTYQERLLSRRKLYFLEDEVIFHCRQDCFTEKGGDDVICVLPAGYASTMALTAQANEIVNAAERAQKRHKGHGSEWPLEMVSYIQNMEFGPLVSFSWDVGFHFWSNTVRDYSGKQFTFNNDISDACTGILHAFEGYSHWPILEGMPEPVLDLALLWTPLTTMKRRLPVMSDDIKPLQFPSWSWLSWEGAITFDLTGNENHLEKLKSRISNFTKSSHGGYFQGEKVKSKVAMSRNHRLKREAVEADGLPISDHQWSFMNKPHGIGNSERVAGVILYRPFEIEQRPEYKEAEKAEKGQDKEQLSIRSPSTTLLRLFAFTLPANPFLRTYPRTPGRQPAPDQHGSQIQPWLWLSIHENQPCGILYGVSDSQVSKLNTCTRNFYFILLSESALVPRTYPRFPSFLDYGDQVRTPKPRPYVPIAMGIVLNIMLVELKGEYAERVAIGQIDAWAWKEAGPMLHLITLG